MYSLKENVQISKNGRRGGGCSTSTGVPLQGRGGQGKISQAPDFPRRGGAPLYLRNSLLEWCMHHFKGGTTPTPPPGRCRKEVQRLQRRESTRVLTRSSPGACREDMFTGNPRGAHSSEGGGVPKAPGCVTIHPSPKHAEIDIAQHGDTTRKKQGLV